MFEKIAITGAVIVMLILAFGFTGSGDYEVAKQSEADYIERVCSGIHTNYLELDIKCEVKK